MDTLTPHAQQLIQTLGSHNTKISEIVSQKDTTVFDAIQEGLDRANEHATSETHWVGTPCSEQVVQLEMCEHAV